MLSPTANETEARLESRYPKEKAPPKRANGMPAPLPSFEKKAAAEIKKNPLEKTSRTGYVVRIRFSPESWDKAMMVWD